RRHATGGRPGRRGAAPRSGRPTGCAACRAAAVPACDTWPAAMPGGARASTDARRAPCPSASLTAMGDARADALIEFVERNLLTDPGRRVTPDTPLLAGGVVDSMGLVLLAAFVEERFGVHLDDADLREGALTTIADVVALLDARR